MPASTTEEEFTLYPRWGDENVIKFLNLSLYYNNLGSAALIFNPPKLCPTKDIFPRVL